jgi:hypothetical protein
MSISIAVISETVLCSDGVYDGTITSCSRREIQIPSTFDVD